MNNFLKPKIKDRKLTGNLWITFLFVLSVFLPDMVIKYACALPIKVEMLFFLGVLLFGLLLSLANKIVFLFFVLLVFLMQAIQLNFMVYFGSPIDPANIMNIFRETRDIFDVSYLKETFFNEKEG